MTVGETMLRRRGAQKYVSWLTKNPSFVNQSCETTQRLAPSFLNPDNKTFLVLNYYSPLFGEHRKIINW